MASSAVGSIPCCNCGEPADRALSCPNCLKLGFRDSVFCTKKCFVDNWKTHKAIHKKTDPGAYVFPEGTVDAFPTDQHVYTGTLRAVYPAVPVPMRTLPESISRPDYALDSERLLSIPERWSAVWGGKIWGKAEEVGRVIGYGLKEAKSQKASPKFGRVHTKVEIEAMRKVGRLAREVLDLAAAAIRVGITTLEIDEIVHKACIERNSYPSPLGYRLFPRSVCTSVNEVICHGIPDARPLQDGDIINLDVTLYHEGFHGDVNATYPVGDNVAPETLQLIATTRECLDEAIRSVKPGTLFKDVGGIIEPIARRDGFSTNRTYVGHGINELFHCAPNIAHYANSRSTVGQMKEGMIFTIEPMICQGNQQDLHWPDNWTAVTSDGKPSAQFEETMLVTATGVEVLTAAPGWTLPPKKAIQKGKNKA